MTGMEHKPDCHIATCKLGGHFREECTCGAWKPKIEIDWSKGPINWMWNNAIPLFIVVCVTALISLYFIP